MAKEILVALVILTSFAHPAPIADDLVVNLPDGRVQGAKYLTGNNEIFYGFRGIPYATPPTGDLRFELPRPAEPWSGVLDASTDSKFCPSTFYFNDTELESEDCLYINVYVPVLKHKEKLPVMFWIHGGGFVEGNSGKSLYGPDFLVEADIIMVSLNYRLGPFGFVSTGDASLPGNLGLKDQNLALKWTRKNIEYFGGDPEKITIFGESAGGGSASLHLLSKQSAGLFRAAIVESGSALNYWSVDSDPRTAAFLLADAIPGGNYGNDTGALKEFLKNRTTEEIMAAALSLSTQGWPTLEVESEDAFLTEFPYELFSSGFFNQVPTMIGLCAQESLMFLYDLDYTKTTALLYDTVKTSVIPEDLFPNATDETVIVDKIRSIYLSEGELFSNNLVAFADLYSDKEFTTGVIKHAELASRFVPVYFYQFAYFGRAFTQPFIEGSEKASHMAEIPFIFNMSEFSGTTDPADLLTQERMVTLWTNFAKYLNPTPEKVDLFDNITWPLLDAQNFSYLNINDTLEVRTNFKGNTYPKWNDIYQIYGKKPFITF